jgi:excisionase family DNA binding protein
MNFSYDKKADAIAFVLKPGAGVVRDVEIAPNVFVGYAKDGSVTEIQFVDVSLMENPWFNLQAAAAMLGISERTLQRRIQEGVIKPKKVGREYQLTPKDLEKLKKAD